MEIKSLVVVLLFLSIVVLGFTLSYILFSEISDMKVQIRKINESLNSIEAVVEKVSKTSNTLSSEISSMKTQIKEVNESLNMIKTVVEKVSKASNTSGASGNYTYVTISELVSNPSYYENRKIVVVGEFHYIAMIPERRYTCEGVSGKTRGKRVG